MKCACVLAALVFGSGTALGFRLPIPAVMPLPQRVATARAVVVGKVAIIYPMPAQAQGVNYIVSEIVVTEWVAGKDEKKRVKIGCVLPPMAPGRRPVPGIGADLQKNQDVLLILTDEASDGFHKIGQAANLVTRKSATFQKDVTEVKRLAKLLAKPMESLKAKSADDRFTTAAMLVLRYRAPVAKGKEEEIPADESKLILKGLAEGNFAATNTARMNSISPALLFYTLGEKTGWTEPKDFRQVPAAMKKWLNDNAATYRIKRFVASE